MNVSLTPELEAMIREKVDSGRYASASEVVREALRILEGRESELRYLQDEISKGARSIAEGRTVTYTPELMEELKTEAIQRSSERKLSHRP